MADEVMEGCVTVTDASERSDGTLSGGSCLASAKSSTNPSIKPLTLTNKDRNDLQISEHSEPSEPSEPSKIKEIKETNESKESEQKDTTQSHELKPLAPTNYLFDNGRIQVTDPHLATVMKDMYTNPQGYKTTAKIDGIPASCFTALYPADHFTNNNTRRAENISGGAGRCSSKKRKVIINIQDPRGNVAHESSSLQKVAAVDNDIKFDKSVTMPKDEKVKMEEGKGERDENDVSTPAKAKTMLVPRNKKGIGSRYTPATSSETTQIHSFSVDGTMMDLPVLSMNVSGVQNTKMCPPCARLKSGGHFCTGSIPVCDQCAARGLDAEMCCSEELLSVIRRRRKEEGGGGGGGSSDGGRSGFGKGVGSAGSDAVGDVGDVGDVGAGGKIVRLLGMKD